MFSQKTNLRSEALRISNPNFFCLRLRRSFFFDASHFQLDQHGQTKISNKTARVSESRKYIRFISKSGTCELWTKRSRTPQALAGRRPTGDTVTRLGKAESGRFRGALGALPPPKCGGKGLGAGRKCRFAAAAALGSEVVGTADLGREDCANLFPNVSLQEALCGRLGLSWSASSAWIFTKSSLASRCLCKSESFEAFVS